MNRFGGFHDGSIRSSNLGTKGGGNRVGTFSAVPTSDKMICSTGIGNARDGRGRRGWDWESRYSNRCISIFNFISIVYYT